ncbi:MAG: 4-hydroxythreonine-4-phosphate dehydrogenase PdxA [Bacteroidales bacterium]|nr:MAG: 4-hydroxythreonine-4-phosphate dehydrogenase PdxA [Bacteroidales bacterium]
MTCPQEHKPVLGITMGDPAGIGPEIAAKAIGNKTIYKICHPVLIGNVQIMENAVRLAGTFLSVNKITEISQASFREGIMNIYEIGGVNTDNIRSGEISAEAGDLAFRIIKTAIDLNMQGKVDGTVTGPVHKESINKAGHNFSGHTEVFAHFTDTRKYAMMLADKNFKIAHVTTHVQLREACDLITKQRVLDVILMLDSILKKLGIKYPRIGVAGLNPHSSDGGLFGYEEANEIIPAIGEVKKSGIHAEGPVPPDTLFALAYGGRYDGCVAMYHDQGHIPFKLLGFKWDKQEKRMKNVSGVNITLGLPIVRTSVDHGTAFEIAGKGIASPDALNQAIEYAVKLLK